MENNYPANSHRAREAATKPVVEKPKAQEKRVEKVVEGDVVRRKRPLGKRFAEIFFAGDTRGVVSYVIMDVLLPAAKDTFADAFSQGVERMLFGEVRSTSRRTGGRPSGAGGYVSYNRYSQQQGPGSRRDEEREISRRARSSHDFDEIIVSTRAEAEEIIDRLFDLVSRYEAATVADLYELVGVKTKFTDDRWGWTDIRGAGITRIRSGYLLDLPRPEPLD